MKKSPENDRGRLTHMLEAAQEAHQFSIGHTRTTLENNRLLQLALVKAVEIVGEAASQITDEFQAKHTQIPWAQIRGRRHRLVHAYYDIDLAVLWDTVSEALPPLIAELQQIISSDDEYRKPD